MKAYLMNDCPNCQSYSKDDCVCKIDSRLCGWDIASNTMCNKIAWKGLYCLEHMIQICSRSVKEGYGDVEWCKEQLDSIRAYLEMHPEEALEI